MPDLRQLRTFIAVAETLNFTRAAEQLSVGQQAVSKTISQLEAELGVELVERTTREVGLTRAGQRLFEAGRPALLAVDGAFESAAGIGRGLSGTIDIGHSPAISASEVQSAIDALRSQSAELNVSVHQVRPGDVEKRLLAGALDLVLGRTTVTSPRIDSAPLRPTQAVLCMPKGHRFAERTWVSLAELDGERLLTFNPPGTPYTDLQLALFEAAGATVEPVEANVMGAPSQTQLAELEEMDAVMLLPAGEYLPPGVATVPFREPVNLPLMLMWSAGRPLAAMRRIREFLSTPG